MLKEIRLTNFRSHAQTRLVLGPGLNVIVGLSNSGKTNLMRAVRWTVFNRPTGGRLLKKDVPSGTGVSAELVFDDGHVSLSRKGSKQEYNANGEAFSGFGASVPDKVLSVLNLGELNIQSQHDAPFLVGESGGEIARVINRVTRAENLDKMVKDCAKIISDDNKEVARIRQLVKELELERDSLSERIKNAEPLVSEFRAAQKELQKHEAAEERLVGLLENLLEAEAALEDAPDWEKLGAQLKAAKVLDDKVQKLSDKARQIENHLETLAELNEVLSSAPDWGLVRGKIQSAQILAGRLTEREGKRLALGSLTHRLKRLKTQLDEKDGALLDAKTDLIQGYKREGVCPACRRKIGQKEISNLLEAL